LKEQGWHRRGVESDSLLAVNFYNSNNDNRSELRAICLEVREIRRAFLALAFRSLDVMQTTLFIYVLSILVMIGGGVCGSTITQVFLLTFSGVIVILSVNI
jgi:hypothetical protein